MKLVSLVIVLVTALTAAPPDAAPPAAAPPDAAPPLQAASGSSGAHGQALTHREPALNATPLGLEVGYATLAGVRSRIAGSTKLALAGESSITGGPVYTSDGDGLGVDGLSNLSLIFDAREVLVGVLLTLPGNAVGAFESLAGQYAVAENRIDSIKGRGSASFIQGDSIITLNAPQASFSMDLSYTTVSFKQDANKYLSGKAAQEKCELPSEI